MEWRDPSAMSGAIEIRQPRRGRARRAARRARRRCSQTASQAVRRSATSTRSVMQKRGRPSTDFADEVDAGRRLLYAAFDGTALVGTVQVILAAPAEPTASRRDHEADRASLGARSRNRRRAHGAAEAGARARGRRFWSSTRRAVPRSVSTSAPGWQRLGVIPGYALNPDGSPCDTTVFWKALGD